jgi:DNA-binding protein H-NS
MATLEQIQAKLKKLQAQAEAMLVKKAQTAVDKIRELMLEHGLTTADIEAQAKVARGGKAAGKDGLIKGQASSGVKPKGAAKYQHPKTGATWSGHGRAPAWIAEAKDRTKFLIAGMADSVAAGKGTAGKAKTLSKKSASTSRATAGKGQPKGPQPALYRDPKSGATWSGRGRAPGWIGGDRSKFLIGGVVAESKEPAPTAAAKPKLAQVAKGATQKSVAKKIATKKTAAKKVATAKKASAVKAPTKKAATTAAAKKVAVKKAPVRKVAAKKVAENVEVASAIPDVSATEATA